MSERPANRLPAIDRLLRLPDVVRLLERFPRNLVVAAAREAVDHARTTPDAIPEDWAADIGERVTRRAAPSLHPVINATGVILHTNLGRAPLAAAAIEAAVAVAAGYSNLELDLATGSRGSRLDHCAPLLAERAGAAAAMVVNNAAGALVLALNAIAAGREVIISRGELIEIGGSFRIPDIIGRSGAILREVGTTNRTHLADYRDAITERTGALLVVHRSNFSMTGFVASPALAELAALARERSLPLVHDAGAGLLVDLDAFGLRGEPLIPSLAAVADLVVFSGDKLLGGPQAGCLVGRADLVARLRTNPFARALRADKITLAALEATLALYRDPHQALGAIPVLRMLTADPGVLTDRARRLVALLPAELEPRVEAGFSAVGGGSFPAAELPTALVTFGAASIGAQALALQLRLGSPPVLVRVESGRVVVDPRTFTDAELPLVVAAVAGAPWR